MVVDAVSEVYNVDAGATQLPPDVCGSVDTIFVKGLATVEKKMLILLDIDRLIGDIIANESMHGFAAA
jgi:purine-binding chemotaxis protein CheW